MVLTTLLTGQGKPQVITLFKPVADELHTLYDEGFQWYNNGKLVITSDFVLILLWQCCYAMLANVKQFNGEYDCGLLWVKDKAQSVFIVSPVQTKATHEW